MAGRPSVSVVIPAYNEVGQIGATVRDIQRYFASRELTHEIIVSVDGTDGTREAVAEMARTDPALRVIGQPDRRGKGRGIREAIRHATGDLVGFVDADHKTPFEEFDRFAPLFDQGYDVVIGSRSVPGAVIERRQPLHRRLGSRGFGAVMHLILGLREIPDTQCGFKFFRRQVACDLFARQRIDSYMFDVEILYLGLAAGYRIAQVPVRWRDDGDSRLRLVVGNAGHAIDLFRIRFGTGPRDMVRDVQTSGSDKVIP